MQLTTSTNENPLDRASAELGAICEGHDDLAPPFDAGSLSRMRAHIININHSVLASTQDHVNAAKRLNDFARTLARSSSHFEAQDGDLAARMAALSRTLQAAGEELANADAVPKWPAPALTLKTT